MIVSIDETILWRYLMFITSKIKGKTLLQDFQNGKLVHEYLFSRELTEKEIGEMIKNQDFASRIADDMKLKFEETISIQKQKEIELIKMNEAESIARQMHYLTKNKGFGGIKMPTKKKTLPPHVLAKMQLKGEISDLENELKKIK